MPTIPVLMDKVQMSCKSARAMVRTARSRYLLACVAALATVACSNSSSGTKASPPTSTTIVASIVQTTTIAAAARRVDIGGLQFDLPPELRYHEDGWTSSMESVSGFYANVELAPACQVFSSGGSCGWPVQTLPAGAIPASADPASRHPNNSSPGCSTPYALAEFGREMR